MELENKDDFEVYLIANVGNTDTGTKIIVKTESEDYEFTLPVTTGPFPGRKNFQRFRLPGLINLEAGPQRISLSSILLFNTRNPTIA